MARCPSCEYPLPDNRERVGARCPSCRDPLYEPPGRFARPARQAEAVCALHPGNESIGPCGRCGNYLCEVCRTRWRDQILCPACVERALSADEATPEQAKSQFRQALLAVLCGGGAWVIAILLILLVVLVTAHSEPNLGLIVLLGLGIFAAALPAVFGLGQSITVLRARGQHMILATIGLMLSGLYIGMLLGIVVLVVWQA